MKDLDLKHKIPKVKIKHSESNNAWNIVSTLPGSKYKIARIPYMVTGDEVLDMMRKHEALEHAIFIEYCFNNSNKIIY